MGEYYLKQKDQVKATASFKKALELVEASGGRSTYYRYMYLQNQMILDRMNTAN